MIILLMVFESFNFISFILATIMYTMMNEDETFSNVKKTDNDNSEGNLLSTIGSVNTESGEQEEYRAQIENEDEDEGGFNEPNLRHVPAKNKLGKSLSSTGQASEVLRKRTNDTNANNRANAPQTQVTQLDTNSEIVQVEESSTYI